MYKRGLEMNKKLLVLFVIVLFFILIKSNVGGLLGPSITEPVFVQSLIYSEDMDIDLNYVAPRDFNKSIKSILIPDAPQGIDCVVYGEAKKKEMKYTVSTVNIGINCDHWNEETGIGNDLKINKLIINWNDGTQTTEEVGEITVIGGNQQFDDYAHTKEQDEQVITTYVLKEAAEITGFDFPYTDEIFHMVTNITMNGIPIDEISIENPVKLKKNEECVITYQVDDKSKSKYGTVWIQGFIMGKRAGSEEEEKIAALTFSKMFGFDVSAVQYLKDNL